MASIYVSRATRNQTHGIPLCSTTSKSSQQELCYIRPSPMQSDATIFLAIRHRPVSTFSYSQLFRLFDFFNLPTTVAHFSPFIHLIFNRPSLVVSNTPSDLPMPLFTSDLHRRYRIYRCCQILTFGEEILAFRNSAPAPVPVPPTTLSPLATTGYKQSYWPIEYVG